MLEIARLLVSLTLIAALAIIGLRVVNVVTTLTQSRISTLEVNHEGPQSQTPATGAEGPQN